MSKKSRHRNDPKAAGRIEARPSSPGHLPAADPDDRRIFGFDVRHWVVFLLILATVPVYWQVRHFEFTNFDDNKYISENPYLQKGITKENLKWALTADLLANDDYADYWQPVTLLSRLVDAELFGMNPAGHHLVNLAIHVLNVILLFLIWNKMTRTIWQSAFVAALFTLHPLRVESVAWVVERKDVLSAFFWLLTIWSYIRYCELPGLKRYLPVLAAFVLGLLSKPILVMLPVVLLLLDFWPLGRMKIRPFEKKVFFNLFIEKLPLMLLAVASAAVTLAVGQPEAFKHSSRAAPISISLVAYVCYLWKTIYPLRLAVYYPPWPAFRPWQIIGSGMLVLGLTFLALRQFSRRPYLPVGWIWFLLTLLPVVGLVHPATADRFTYVPHMGLLIIPVWGMWEMLAGAKYRKEILSAAAALILSACLVLTWNQLGYWKNSVTLFEHTLNVTANNWMPHYNLAVALVKRGELEKSEHHLLESLRINPLNEEAHNNLGNLLAWRGKQSEAMAHYAEAIRIKPSYVKAYYNMGNALFETKQYEEAVEFYAEACRLNPNYVEAHYNLGTTLAYMGKFREALDQFKETLRINPGHQKAQYNLHKAENILAQMGGKPSQ